MSHRCPVCSDDYEPCFAECPHCCGDRYFYRTADGEMITEEEYGELPENSFPTRETCPKCSGEGVIMVDPGEYDEYEHEYYS
jgi:DnaJ-class molecular chaperone